MKKSTLLSAAIVLSVSASCFAASLQSLDKAQATKEFQGNTITTVPLATLENNLINNAFTGYFSKDGKARGQFASKPDNGPQNDDGTWKVENNGTLCATWQHWNNSQPICVTLYKLGNGLLLVNEKNKKFETLILKDNIKSGDQMG